MPNAEYGVKDGLSSNAEEGGSRHGAFGFSVKELAMEDDYLGDESDHHVEGVVYGFGGGGFPVYAEGYGQWP